MATEAELMARYCDGDASAFRELHARVAPRLVGYLARMSGDRALAEDLAEPPCLDVRRARRSSGRGADPVPWMFAIAHRTFLDEIRRRKRSRVDVAKDERGVPEQPAAMDGAPADASPVGADPELVQAALAALDQLPPA